MELLSIAAVLLGFLALLLGAGVWIAVALMATGWAGMPFAGGGSPAQLSTPGLPIGVSEEDADFTTSSYQVPPGADILLYSDGAFELDLPDGRVWSLPQFVDVLAETATSAGWTLDDLVERLRERSESGLFDDDCTLVRLSFP